MNRGELKARAREISDLDTTDVSDVLLEMYIKDGFDRIIAMERSWPFYETSASMAAVAGTQSYALSAISSGQFREISSVFDEDSGYRLQYIGHDEAEGSYFGPQVVGRPAYYSFWEQSLHLWPTPPVVVNYALRGYRIPLTTWTASDAIEIDMDARLHQSLVYFAVAKMFEYQEDAEVAAVWERQFTESARMARDDIMRIPVNSPIILSQGRRY